METDQTGSVTVEFGTDESSQLRLFAGASQWVFTPFEGPEPVAVLGTNSPTQCYVATRVTPADDDIAMLAPTWDNVHNNVLLDWEALAPCMDNWLKLGDEDQCRSLAPLIKKLTSRDQFNNFRYMPVTRGMSSGQRTLLHNWCDNPVEPFSSSVRGMTTAELDDVATAEQRDIDLSADEVDLGRGFAAG